MHWGLISWERLWVMSMWHYSLLTINYNKYISFIENKVSKYKIYYNIYMYITLILCKWAEKAFFYFISFVKDSIVLYI